MSSEKIKALAGALGVSATDLDAKMKELDIRFEGRWGILTYDVPDRSMYSRIFKKIGPQTVMLNWSSYLFQWGNREQLRATMESLRFDKDGNELPLGKRVRWHITNQAPHEDDTLHRRAGEALEDVIRRAKESLGERLAKAEELQAQY
jgi:hypothetical protein